MIWSSVKLVFVFLLGFVCAKGFDMLVQSEDIVRLLQNGGINLSNEKTAYVRTVNTSTPVTEEGKASDGEPNVPLAILKESGEEDKVAESTPSSPAIVKESGFSSIVETAYKRALEPKISATPRKFFDVDWWENESKLTTEGGLKHHDRLLLGRIYYDAKSVFEFGLGESTYIANYVGVPRYSGIDSDPEWIGMARSKVAPHFRFYLGDIGSTKAWGYPTSPRQQKNVLNYQLSPLIVEPQPFDVYMIDGRWRLPALLASFLHASDRGAPHSETIGLVHDCGRTHTSGRLGYKRADHLLTLVQHSGHALCVYKRKPETTDEDLTDLWHKYMDELERR